MNVACDHCDRTARGSRDDLIDAGWCRVTLFAPTRCKCTGCPDHAKDALRDAVAAIDAEQERAGRRRPLAEVVAG